MRLRLALASATTAVSLVLVGCSGESAPTRVPTLPAPVQSASPGPSATPSPSPSPTPTFDRAARSIDDPASTWVVVNKLRPLQPSNYEAADLVDVPVPYVYAPRLRREAADAVVALFAAAQVEAGLALQSQSAYRSFQTQTDVYNGWVSSRGQAAADLTSARPGHSEHQTGLALDISSRPAECSLTACFGQTAHGQWLAANAWRFGFIVRYPEGKTAITGYEYEPWHFRYVGVELATEMHDTGVATLEEFFGLPPAPTY